MHLLCLAFASPGLPSAHLASPLSTPPVCALPVPGLPQVIPYDDRALLSTAAGVLFHELSHSPAATLASVRTLLENALELDPGRYVRGGGSDVLLYCTRLAMRVEAFARFLLSPAARAVRGLRTPAARTSRSALRAATEELRTALDQQVLPLLISWYARCRRENAMAEACTIAAHISFAYSSIAAHAAETARMAGGEAAAVAAYTSREELPLFALLSSRVFINVHHDFGIEPRTKLPGAKGRPAGRGRRDDVADADAALGFEPLDVFDLWQVSAARLRQAC